MWDEITYPFPNFNGCILGDSCDFILSYFVFYFILLLFLYLIFYLFFILFFFFFGGGGGVVVKVVSLFRIIVYKVSLWYEDFFMKCEIMFAHGGGSWTHSLQKTRLTCTTNHVAAADLATQWARTSTAIALT